MIASSGSMLLVSLLAAVMSCNGVYLLLVEGTQRSFQFASISGDFRVDRQKEIALPLMRMRARGDNYCVTHAQ